jgi:hypothetical protein
VPISPSTEDLYRETWQSGIPPQYRANDQTRIDKRGRAVQAEQDRRYSSAIIAPPPSKALVSQFFAIYQITAGNAFSIIKVEAEHGDKRVRLFA